MLKFLRKYNTLILVVGGSLLMVVFLVPQAIEQIGQNPKRVPYATIEGRTLNMRDFQQVQRDWQHLTQIVPEALGGLEIQDVDHWLLLTHEAERYNLIGGVQDGANSMDYFAEYVAQFAVRMQMQANPWLIQTNEQYLQILQSQADLYRGIFAQRVEDQTRAGRPPEVYYRALAKLRGVARLLVTYQSLAGLSIPETEIAAADLFDRLTADVAVIPASAFRPDPDSLAMDDVRSHFETYRTTRRGEGDFGFGYMLPDAVRVEWLQVNSEAIVDSLDASSADLLEYYRRFRDTNYFGQEFTEARNQVRTDYINSLAQQRLNDISSAVQRERLRSVQALPRDTDDERYRIVTDDWQAPTLEHYAGIVREASGLTGQAAEDLVTIRHDSGEFLSLQDLRASELSIYRYEVTANEIIAFGDLMMLAREFSGDERVNLQRGLLFGPVVLPQSRRVRDLAFVRITDVRHEGPADSVEEVEQRVREDLATLRGYENLQQREESFRSAFADAGFTWLNEMDFATAEGTLQYNDTVLGMESAMSDFGEPIRRLAASPLPEAFVRAARSFDPLVAMSQVSADERTISVLMPDTLALGVGTITAYRPATIERLREGMMQIEQRLEGKARQISVEAVYTFDSLARRLGFEKASQED